MRQAQLRFIIMYRKYYSHIALPQIAGTEIPGPVWALLLRSRAFFGRCLAKKIFLKRREDSLKGGPFGIKKIPKFLGFLRLSQKVVKGSGLILAYPCSTRQDGNFDVAHDMIWRIIFKNLSNYNRVV